LDSYGLQHEEKGKPLFCWMMAIITKNAEAVLNMEKDWSVNLKKTLIYITFIHTLLRGRHKSLTEIEDWVEFYTNEKKILRKIAVLKQLYQDHLTEVLLKTELASFKIKIDDEELEPILTSYFRKNTRDDARYYDFIHESFKEYLVAEHYVESILNGTIVHLNVSKPSKETMQFLDGFLELLQLNNPTIISSFLSSYESFFRTFAAVPKSEPLTEILKNFRENIKNNSKSFFEDKSIIVSKKNLIRNSSDANYFVLGIHSEDYKIMWIHRWISLYVLAKIGYEIDMSKVSELLEIAGNYVDPHVKTIPNSNLSDNNLNRIDITGSSLRGQTIINGNISNSKLMECQIENAYFENVNSSFTNFSDSAFNGTTINKCTMTNSKFYGTNFNDTTLTDSDFSHSKFSHRNDQNVNSVEITKRSTFIKTKITKCDMSECQMNDCILNNSIIRESTFVDVDITTSSLLDGTIRDCNFRGLNARGSDIRNTKFIKVNLTGVNFSNADLRGVDLTQSLTDAIIIDNNTKTKGLKCQIKEVKKNNPKFYQKIIEDNPDYLTLDTLK
jgi:uncharacterized protein YjbI with pentapeptide repeats